MISFPDILRNDARMSIFLKSSIIIFSNENKDSNYHFVQIQRVNIHGFRG